jgi:hypothetical protein
MRIYRAAAHATLSAVQHVAANRETARSLLRRALVREGSVERFDRHGFFAGHHGISRRHASGTSGASRLIRRHPGYRFAIRE